MIKNKKKDVIIYSDHNYFYLISGVSLFTAKISMITCIMLYSRSELLFQPVVL